MDIERVVIISGMVCALVGIWAVPGAFAWGMYLGMKGKHRRRHRIARQLESGKATTLMRYLKWN